MKRVYKMDTPENTVNKIRKIFSDMSIMTYEDYWKSVNGRIYSCGVTIEDCQVLKTLGKGMTKPYCLASGYGELIERIENLILFTGNIGTSYDSILEDFPDTLEVKNYESLQGLNSEKSQLSVRKTCMNLQMNFEGKFRNRVIAGQFYDVFNDEVVYLPYSELLRGVRSNGMCAGNTPGEAIIEGVCEILERMAIKSIFTGEMVPPSIPVEYLKQFPAYKVMEALEQEGITIDVKDCSMGKSFPVLGILIINRNTGKYKYNFGAHPDFNTALQRCIGEVCQVSGGVNSVSEFLTGGMDFDLVNDPYEENDGHSYEFNRLSSFYKALKNSNGKLPTRFFVDQPSYEFKEWRRFNDSFTYENDLKIIFEELKDDGAYVFIRDVSFLGFPAFYVFITDYSTVQVDESFLDLKAYLENKRTTVNEVMMFAKMNRCSEEEIKDLIDYLQLSVNNPKYFNQEDENNWVREVMAVPVKKDVIMCPNYVRSMLYYRLGDYEKSYQELTITLKKSYYQEEEKRYLLMIKEYINLKRIGKADTEIYNLLKGYYNHEMVDEIYDQMSVQENIFRKLDLFSLVDNVQQRKVSKVYAIIRKKLIESKIDQKNLKKSLNL